MAFGSGAANTLAPTGSDVYIHQFTGTGIPGSTNTAKVKFLNTISASTAGGVLGLVNNGGTLDSTSTGNLVTQTNLGSGYASTTLAKLALSPLGANGGPVATIAIVTASSARNAGTVSGAPTTDARGESRPTTGNVDAGAYQLKAPQTITFTLPSPATYGVAPITLTATSDGSTNPITFNHVSGPATLAGNVLTVTGAGDIVVHADQAGNASFASGFATRTLTVNPATLTYTADVKTRPYGAANPALTGTVTGFVNGETVATATTGTLAFGTPATTGSGVGGYPITGNGLSAANYTFAQAAGNATALSVTRVPLTVTANGNEKVYGQPNPLLTFTATGFVNGDTAASAVTGNLGTAATATSGAGLYPITIGTLAAPNYDVTFTPATLAVIKASLAITADNKMRVAGQANPALTAGFAGFVNGDTAAVVTGLVLTTDATATSPAGTYPITATGATAANYAITFVPGTLTVTANTDPGTPPTDPGSTQLVGFRQFAAGADVGGGAVTLYNPDKSVRFTTAPFGADFTGGYGPQVRTSRAMGSPISWSGPGRAGPRG